MFCVFLCSSYLFFFFLMIRRPPISTRTDTLFPSPTLFRSLVMDERGQVVLAVQIGGSQVDPHLAGDRPVLRSGPAISGRRARRSEEHTSELQSLMRISYAVFCLKKKKNKKTTREQNET